MDAAHGGATELSGRLEIVLEESLKDDYGPPPFQTGRGTIGRLRKRSVPINDLSPSGADR